MTTTIDQAAAAAVAADATWKTICALEDIPVLGARVVSSNAGDIAVFRNAEDEVFALRDQCAHKAGPLSQGIVFGAAPIVEVNGRGQISLVGGGALPVDIGVTYGEFTRNLTLTAAVRVRTPSN